MGTRRRRLQQSLESMKEQSGDGYSKYALTRSHQRAAEARYRSGHREKIRERLRRRRALAYALVDAARAGGCVDCGNLNLSVLDSDHVRGEKVASIGWMIVNAPLSVLLAELEKCETRCANCHRLATKERRTEASQP